MDQVNLIGYIGISPVRIQKDFRRDSILSPSRIRNESPQDTITDEQLEKNKSQIISLHTELNQVISGLNESIESKLKKQELDYLNGYQIFVQKKETDLKKIVQRLNDKRYVKTDHEDQIISLKTQVSKLQDQQTQQDNSIKELRDQNRYWKQRCEAVCQESQFLQNSVIEHKKKNKILKLTIARLQQDNFKRNQFLKIKSSENDQTFLTAMKDIQIIDQSNMLDSTQDHTQVNSLLNTSSSPLKSQYSLIPTRNLKFENFISTIFKQKLPAVEVQDQIIKYVQGIETNYNELIRQLKDWMAREKLTQKKVISEVANSHFERSEFEILFVECVEEIRKDIQRRRLKNEALNRNKLLELRRQETKEFEESVLKLAHLARSNQIGMADFTSKDKQILLGLFVNNEKILMQMYETLFPYNQGHSSTSIPNVDFQKNEKKMQINQRHKTRSVMNESVPTMATYKDESLRIAVSQMTHQQINRNNLVSKSLATSNPIMTSYLETQKHSERQSQYSQNREFTPLIHKQLPQL